jgi:hypothetical protein
LWHNAEFGREEVSMIRHLFHGGPRRAAAAMLGWAFVLGFAGRAEAVTEAQAREALAAQVRAFVQAEDFAGLEQRYQQALASHERLPSGVLAASQIVRTLPELRPASTGRLVAAGAPIDWRAQEDKVWNDLHAMAARWAAAQPQSSLAAVAQSTFFIAHGFSYRGHGAAVSVPEDGMKVFRAYVGKARQALETRAAAGAKDPGWYVEMLGIARYEQWEPSRFTQLLRQAVAVDPLNHETYFSAALTAMPQWGGSLEAVDGIAEFAARQTRTQEGNALYARVYWAVSNLFGPRLFSDSKADWTRVRAGFDDMVQRYPDPWNLNAYAYFACLAQDKATTQRMLARVGDQPEPAIWRSAQIYEGCRRWAAA